MKKFKKKAFKVICNWLSKERSSPSLPPCDYTKLSCELRPGDVVLVEGRSRISNAIKIISKSTWTHSALVIGRVNDIHDPDIRQRVMQAYPDHHDELLLVEALLGHGTIISPISKYKQDHIRICRPNRLEHEDTQKVVAYAVNHLGIEYDTRQLIDLARFFLPWSILPRRWRSTLFEFNAATPTRTICSTLIASAFNSIDFPLMPFITNDKKGKISLFKHNPRLFTPRDFDYSPYFDIVKFPYLRFNEHSSYRQLPWSDEVILYNDSKRILVANSHGMKVEFTATPETATSKNQNWQPIWRAAKTRYLSFTTTHYNRED